MKPLRSRAAALMFGLAGLCACGAAHANAVLPLLLMVNYPAFVFGSVAIVLVEWWVHVKFGDLRARDALADVFWANLLSTVVVGLGLPVLIATAGSVARGLPGEAGRLAFAAGTWMFDGSSYARLTLGFTFAYLIVCYVLTVYFEARVVAWRWRARRAAPARSARALSWIGNSLTYAGVFAYFVCVFAIPGLNNSA